MHLYDYAKGLVLEAGNHLRQWMTEAIDIETKSNPNDLVTNVDKAVEQFLVDQIKETYPQHQIIGEEGHGHNLTTLEGITWVIDPIDGTLNFVHQGANFAISVGVFKNGEPYAGFVYDVMADTLYHAKAGFGAYRNETLLERIPDTQLAQSLVGMNANWLAGKKITPVLMPIIRDSRSSRAYGSAALEIVHVATGQLGAYITPRLQPWDFAGGMIILEEVGGIATNFVGQPLAITHPDSVIVGNKEIHKTILQEYMKPHEDFLAPWHEHYQG
ncbi:inositol monophosphatase family protein [Staphylococcus americanisciuri]|uniref:inositol-phosphate phosphatase n=1 Tax=Staphylococcus americanisciuri TaxID=2973940 RepID=A0ABT2F2P7_9STAP|nr:inositol monophosphatase family protein [Staphylococcus americanisciuri]MCS4486721.1 inositol monophosphatase family protein [Staphylococcus americanisciuri]